MVCGPLKVSPTKLLFFSIQSQRQRACWIGRLFRGTIMTKGRGSDLGLFLESKGLWNLCRIRSGPRVSPAPAAARCIFSDGSSPHQREPRRPRLLQGRAGISFAIQPFSRFICFHLLALCILLVAVCFLISWIKPVICFLPSFPLPSFMLHLFFSSQIWLYFFFLLFSYLFFSFFSLLMCNVLTVIIF